MKNGINYDYDEVLTYISTTATPHVEDLANNLNTLGTNLTDLESSCHSQSNSSSVFTQVYKGFSNIIGDSNKGLGGLTTSSANILNTCYNEALTDKNILEGNLDLTGFSVMNNLFNTNSNSSVLGSFSNSPLNIKSINNKIKDMTPDAEINYSEVPGLDEERVQGLTKTDDYTIVSSHTQTKPAEEKLYFYDKKSGKYVGSITLDQQGHAGGIAYDEDNGVLYVTGKGNQIGVYDYDTLVKNMKSNNGGKLSEDNNAYKGYIELPNDDASPATIFYDNGKLYSSTFVGEDKGVGYDINVNNLNLNSNNNGKISTGNVSVHETPRMVQGLAVTEYQGEKYEIYSQSYGRNVDSSYCIYKTDDAGNRSYVGKVYSDKAGMEGLDINDRGEITASYEFSKETTTISMENLLADASKDSHTITEVARNFSGSNYDSKNNPYHYDNYIKDSSIDTIQA